MDKKTKIGGFCQDYYAFVDYKYTLQLTDEERIKYLLDIFIVGIERCCEVNNYPKEVFQEIFSEMKQAIENKTFG